MMSCNKSERAHKNYKKSIYTGIFHHFLSKSRQLHIYKRHTINAHHGTNIKLWTENRRASVVVFNQAGSMYVQPYNSKTLYSPHTAIDDCDGVEPSAAVTAEGVT